MIIVYHLNNRITKVISSSGQFLPVEKYKTISEGLFKLSLQYSNDKIIWCREELMDQLDVDTINDFFHHDKMLLSYCPDETGFLGSNIGYVEESPFVKVNKDVTYPTWQVSSYVGVIHSSVLRSMYGKIRPDSDFDYFLSSLGKIGMFSGLICYSEPRLLKNKLDILLPKANKWDLFRFVKQHYKTRWVFLLALNLLLYERKLAILPLISSMLYKKRNTDINLDSIVVNSKKKVIENKTLDVIIPTIGRKEYLFDVLQDLARQTVLPHKIIIVEQNPDILSKSELDFIGYQKWPFKIKHFFIHQTGACNARNLALEQIESEWVFLADDDIRMGENFIEEAFQSIRKKGVKAVSVSCLQHEEIEKHDTIFQWPTFGSGCSIVASEILKDCEFNMGYEHGFGEDMDFGMQLRNQGQDVLYLPKPSLLHRKAPIGGFRIKPVLQWQDEKIQPKPSPTVMMYRKMHHTHKQNLGYKTVLFFKFYRRQHLRNPIKYYRSFQKSWQKSDFWSDKLLNQW